MEPTQLPELAARILSQPTAPFHEDEVRRAIYAELRGLPGVTLQEDSFGNLLALYRKGDAVPRFAIAAHMDHPAYVGEDFLGGVPESYRAKNPPTEDFGAYRMWDLKPFELKDGRIHARVCDDLIGCVTIISTLQRLSAEGAETAFYGLFSRAEEVGFVGAIELAKSGLVPKETTIISLETSSERGGPVIMGAGVIIRVGDRTSIFDSDSTAELVALAKSGGIPFQRALMSAGSCEATAYQAFGYRSAGLCVALGNYHNCGPDEQIAPEFVSLDDVEAMTRLCHAAALAISPGAPSSQQLREDLGKLLSENAKYLRPLSPLES